MTRDEALERVRHILQRPHDTHHMCQYKTAVDAALQSIAALASPVAGRTIAIIDQAIDALESDAPKQQRHDAFDALRDLRDQFTGDPGPTTAVAGRQQEDLIDLAKWIADKFGLTKVSSVTQLTLTASAAFAIHSEILERLARSDQPPLRTPTADPRAGDRWTIDNDAETPNEILIVDHREGIIVARTARLAEPFVLLLVDAANGHGVGTERHSASPSVADTAPKKQSDNSEPQP